MPPQYQRLHGQGAGRPARWADNPEACGIRCVVGVTLGMLFICAVLPVMCKGFTRQQNGREVESKTLIIPLASTSTSTSTSTTVPTTTVPTTTVPTTTTAASTQPAAARSSAQAGGDQASTSGTTTSEAASTSAVAAEDTTTLETTTTTIMTTSTKTTTTVTTATDLTTSTRTTRTTTTDTSTSISSTETTVTTTIRTTTTATTVTTATTTTTLDAAGRARLACKKLAEDTSQLRFPLDFECDEDGACPDGWTCTGPAAACGTDGSSSKHCEGSGPSTVKGLHYLRMGGDPDEASTVVSPVFLLPHGSHRLVAEVGGEAAAHAGLSLHMATDGHQICLAETDAKALRGASFIKSTCAGLSLHGGQGVYLMLRSPGKGEQSTFFVDDVHLLDQDGEDVTEALLIPGVKPKLPELEGPSHGDGSNWIVPPENCCEGHRPVIATYAGKDKMPYIDGAVMLGLSLQWHVPEFSRLCLVIQTMAQKHKDLLTAAGWTLIDIDEWHPSQDHFAHDYWWMIYNKIDIFRVKVDKLLWMDSDMYVWDDSLREVLEMKKVPEGHIAMVKDCAAKNFNSGLMFFKPDLAIYRRLRAGMISHHGWDGLDQPLINKEYDGKIFELDPKFNTHGVAKTCKGVVVAHYTGRNKPTLANAHNLRLVSKGFRGMPYSLRCPRLYEEYFCAMKNARNYLSEELQSALREAGNGQSCLG